MAGEFDEFLPQNKGTSSAQGNFDEFMPNAKVPPAEGLLGSIARMASNMEAGNRELFRNPFGTIMGKGGADQRTLEVYHGERESESFNQQFLRTDMEQNPKLIEEKNTIPAFLATLPENLVGSQLDIAMNPLSAAIEGLGGKIAKPIAKGIGKGASALGKGISKTGRSLFNPSKVYGEALESSKGTVNFKDIIYKYMDDPMVRKVLNKGEVMEKFGGNTLGKGGEVTEKLANLTAKESQDLINAVKVGETKAMLSGDVVKSNKVTLSKFFSDLSKAQNQALEGIKGAKKLYGASKNIGKFVKSKAGAFVTGSALGAGAKVSYDVLK